MKKRIISVMAVLAMLLGPTMMQTKAQNIFDGDEGLKKSLRGEKNSDGENNLNGISLDDLEGGDISLENFAPLSGGILVLGCLGGAYLIGRRRKEQNS
jgi:hypothetical protein